MTPTHIPKKITGPDGKTRTVYVRSPQTVKDMEQIRLGPYATYKPLDVPELNQALRKKPSLVIQAPYQVARRVIRTRLGIDPSAHRVFTGSSLIGEYFHCNESFRSAFPQAKQVYILFGYMEIGNKMLHQVLCEAVFMRYEMGSHVWLMIPKSLQEMAAQWGEAIMNLQILPFLSLEMVSDAEPFVPVSVATPLVTPTGPALPKMVRDTSYPGTGDDTSPENLVFGDMKFAPIEKKKTWKRKY